MSNNLPDVRETEQLSKSFELARDIITRDYLYNLEEMEVCEIPEELKQVEISDFSRIYHFERFVSDKKENMLDKLVTVLNAAYTSGSSVVTIIKGSADRTDYYIGVVNKSFSKEDNLSEQGDTFESTLKGNFPGLKVAQLNKGELEDVCNSIFKSSAAVSSVSGIASLRDAKEKSIEKYIQGLEHLVDSLQGTTYSIVVISDPVSPLELALAKSGYENLYTQLSPFLKSTLSFNESQNVSVTHSQTTGVTNTIGHSASLTQNYSQTSGWSETESRSKTSNKNAGAVVGGVIGAAVGIAATIATAGAAAPVAFAVMGIGSSVGGAFGGAIGATSKSDSKSSTQTGSATESSGKTATETSSSAEQNSSTDGETEGTSQGRTLQFTTENKTIKALLAKIDKHLERLDRCEAFGAFNCSSYIISSDPETNAIVANVYNALMRGENSSLQASYINSWEFEDTNGKKIVQYLEKFTHPLFYRDSDFGVLVSPASIFNSYEVAVNIGLPKKSIKGLPVFESVSFGRDVHYLEADRNTASALSLGNIFHMGEEDKQTPVMLDVKSLAMHTFVTGSTGSGKSNTVYQILRELDGQGVKFLVVEPAKGEYKHIFGNGIASVYGTNPAITPILKINPFRFPKGIHVLEHIDRLVEIFNVCWPMYAAMPAVLKDSVERAYVSAGWDLTDSNNRYSESLFPTFVDVLDELNNVISQSAFSQEVKDNYIGALSTRIKSLTNGIYGKIFGNDEIGDESLFDNNAIVDLSRVGSVETKSLIMGILVMRLQEYRMTSGKMNADLKHVTVLEEAHNLLKRTSTEQSSESSNLLGKSVEMLANAIAEVRTYGEGFIIADQAPGLLDLSVIRNTNTKIIMRLPEEEDRQLVGKAANVSNEQIAELSKLPTGVAAIYQNNWIEPILCQVTYKGNDNVCYNYCPSQGTTIEHHQKQSLIKALVQKQSGEKMEMTIGELVKMIINMAIPTSIKIQAIRALSKNGRCSKTDIASVLSKLVFTAETEKLSQETESLDEWKEEIVYSIDSPLDYLAEDDQNLVIECILIDLIAQKRRPPEYLDQWRKYLEGTVI
ncbi:MAG: ATP-binding protein [Ruminococcaceae bacterium]|nr:ATP-binding protein [Oscillospiraceae bacterium]